jgi:hypothetical protein
VSASRTRQAYRLLHQVLDMAVAYEAVDRSFGVVKLPRMPKREIQCLDLAGIDALATAAGDYAQFVRFLSYTGLRWVRPWHCATETSKARESMSGAPRSTSTADCRTALPRATVSAPSTCQSHSRWVVVPRMGSCSSRGVASRSAVRTSLATSGNRPSRQWGAPCGCMTSGTRRVLSSSRRVCTPR